MVKLARIVNETPEISIMTGVNEEECDNNDSFDDDVYINEGGPLSSTDIENELNNAELSTNGM